VFSTEGVEKVNPTLPPTEFPEVKSLIDSILTSEMGVGG